MTEQIVDALPRFLAEHCCCPFIRPLIEPGLETTYLLGGRPGWIPAGRNTENPKFGGELISQHGLQERLDLAGFTGWHYVRLETLFIVLDYDASDHGAGRTEAELDQVLQAARKLGWVFVRRSKGGRGVHLIVILSTPMPAATGKAHTANAQAVIDFMCSAADFDFREFGCAMGQNAYCYARDLKPGSFEVVMGATAPTPFIAAPSVEDVKPRDAASELLPQHHEDIRRMQAAGYVAHWDGDSLKCHSHGFTILNRIGYSTSSQGSDPTDQNAFAFPLDCGGWIVNRFDVRPEAESPGWRANAEGFACRRIDPPLDFGEDCKPIEPVKIHVTAHEGLVTQQTVAALANAPGAFQRGNELVRISRATPPPPGISRAPDTPVIDPMPPAAVRELLSNVCEFRTWRKRDEKLVRTLVPSWLTPLVMARTSWPVPSLEGITETPLLRADGSILDKPGYDKLSGYYYVPSATYPVVDDPKLALMRLMDLVSDFPFSTVAHKSAWLAGVLTPLAKLAYDGPSPMFLLDANSPGAGKSLLIDITSLIVSGRPMSRFSAPSSDDEWRKRLTAIAIAGSPLVLVDNVVGNLGSASLDAALTSTTWSDRILGESRTVTVPLRPAWYASGNNLTVARDTARRVLHVRLVTPLERPEQRTGFRYPDLIGYVTEHRADLAACALALLRSYLQAGAPDQKISPWGSFESWSRLVRNCIVWHGLPDPGETRIALTETSDNDSGVLRMLLAGFQEVDPDGNGVTAADACNKAYQLMPGSNDFAHPTLRQAMEELPGDKKHALGVKLRAFRERVLDGMMFVAEKTRNKINVWRVKSVA